MGSSVMWPKGGVHGQENGFQSFNAAIISGAGENAADRAWRRRMGADFCAAFAEWRSAHHVPETAGRIASGRADTHFLGSRVVSLAPRSAVAARYPDERGTLFP